MARSSSATCDPMNPAPPVTKEVNISGILSLFMEF
jgi:hypothetical protein